MVDEIVERLLDSPAGFIFSLAVAAVPPGPTGWFWIGAKKTAPGKLERQLKFVAGVVTVAGVTMGIHCPTPPRPFPD